MTIRKPVVLALCILISILIAALAVWLMLHESPAEAEAALQKQDIEITDDNFIAEALQGHRHNVRHFILLGKNAQTMSALEFTALAAAAQSKDLKTLKLVMATLPYYDASKVADIITKQDHYGRNAIIAAAVSGNEAILFMVLSKLPADPARVEKMVNLQDIEEKTALYYAVMNKNQAMINALLALGADVAIPNRYLETPLIVAIKTRDDAAVPALINADKAKHQQAISVQMADTSGKTPLIYAIEQQNTGVVKLLIDAQANLGPYERSGITPLMAAAEVGNQAIAGMLIAAGAKLDIADTFGNTPLTNAIGHGHIEMAKLLLSKGADPTFHTTNITPLQTAVETNLFDIDFFNSLLARYTNEQLHSLGIPFLFAAVERKNTAIIKRLLDAGFDPNSVNEKGETLLYHAILTGNEDVALMLINKGADVRQTGVGDITPLQLAAENNEISVVKKLLSMDVGFNQKTASGYTIAEISVYEGHPEILQMLLDKGSTVDLDFSVMWAIRDGHGKSVGVLLKHGANPNVMNENGETALWLSADAGENEAVQALVAHHALIDYTDKQGLTPLMIASRNGHLPTVKLLAEGGAKIDLKDNYGMTALAHATYSGKPDVVEYLISKGANIRAVDGQGRSLMDLAALGQDPTVRDKIIAILKKK